MSNPANTANRFTGGYESDVLSVSTYEMLDIENKLIFDPAFRHALMLHGPTGVGKSSIQRQLLANYAERNQHKNWEPTKPDLDISGILEVYGNWGLVDMRLATKDTIDMQGLLNLGDTHARWVPPNDLPVVGQEDRFPEYGILFLDELLLATPSIQAIAYSIALDHKAGTFKILPKWKVLAASNLSREKSFSFDMPHPLKNRFLHYFIRCELDTFKRWAFQHQIDERVIYFLTWNPDFLHQDIAETAYGFPTPRSWEMTSDLLKRFENGHRLVNITGAIGSTTASLFKGFLDVYDEETKGEFSNIEAVLDGKVKPKPFSTEKPGRAYAVAARLVAHARQHNESCDKVLGFILSDTWEDTRELARACVRDLNDALKDKHDNVNPHFEKAVAKWQPKLMEVFKNML